MRSRRIFGWVAGLVGAGVASFAGGGVEAAPPALARAAVTPATAVPPRAPAPKPEPAITTPGPVGDYVRAVHGRLHGRWTEDFIKTVSATHPADHQLNNPSRQVTIALSIRWDGSIADRSVTKSSGAPDFDRAALDIARKSAPYPLPPADVISDDSFAHVEWTFARDHRACAAGAEVTRVDDPLDVSLPRLIMNNRVAEALRRIGQSNAAGNGNGHGLDRFARLYLGRIAPDPVLDVAASFALATAGDQAQAPRLRAALTSRATVDVAARGLQKLGLDICEIVRDGMTSGTASGRELAIAAARAVAISGAAIAGCRPALVAVVADGRQPTALRLQALDTLVTFMPAAEVRPAVMAAIEDKDPAVRGAALLASVRKGVGRPEMYRLAPLLRDKTVEVRGAASAGMVRAGGDIALDQLYLLGRETDPRPGTWVAAELAQMSSRPSAEFLGKMLKKNNLPVQVAAARALAGRNDAPARSELDAAKADDRLPREVRAIAGGDLKASATAGVAAKPAGDRDRGLAEVGAVATATQPFYVLLKSNRGSEAGGWILEHFTALEPRAGVDVLAAWLLRPPATPPIAGAAPSPPQTAVPATAPVGSPQTTANALNR